MPNDNTYILTELWNARPAWLALSSEERQSYIDNKIGPFLGSMVEKGAELLACTVNDNRGAERLEYRYMAVWRVRDRLLAEAVVDGAKEIGFLEYFDQANVSGVMVGPDALNADMIELQA